jgi:asparagine synthetase B (glutamine-hydrolysing)
MSRWEIATGWVSGFDSAPEGSDHVVDRAGPRAALEAELATHLSSPPVYVAFSGGRDSSAVLAVAAHVARKHGFDLPIPVTLVYPGKESTEETDWQRLVAEHVGLAATQVRVPPGGSDIVGPTALDALLRRGVCWPPGMFMRVPLHEAIAPATLLTGEGGDEMLGARRVSPVARVVRSRRPPRGEAAKAVGYALVPAAVRRRVLNRVTRGGALELPWLREPYRQQFLSQLNADAAAEPLRHAASTRRMARARALTLGVRHMNLLAADYGVRMAHPLVASGVVAALARYGRSLGLHWLSRTEMLRLLAGDLLPEAVISRTAKAAFNSVAVDVHAREFVARWDGSGLDDTLVDIDALRDQWLSPSPHAGSLALLQAARLAGGRT